MPAVALEAPHPHIGFFGKLPSHGDFVARRLRAQTRFALERWLHEGVRKTLDGPRLTDGLRYAAAPGALCPFALCGLLVASQDRVGRDFPLMLAVERPASGGIFTEAWFAALEAALQTALASNADADGLAAALSVLETEAPAGSGALEAPRSLWWRAGGAAGSKLEIDQPLTGASFAALVSRTWGGALEPSPALDAVGVGKKDPHE